MATREQRFDDSFGPFVDKRDVAEAVRAGHLVWSFGYGAGESDDFTVLDLDDLDTARTSLGLEFTDERLAETLDEWWGPFRSNEWMYHAEQLIDREVFERDRAAIERVEAEYLTDRGGKKPLDRETKLVAIAGELEELLVGVYGLEASDLNNVGDFDTPEQALRDYLLGHAENLLAAIGE